MKLIHLKNLKRECVLVEFPEDDVAREPYGFDQTHIYHGHAPIVYHLKRGDHDDSTRAINLDMGYGWKLFGKFTDLKEDDFYYLVDSVEQHGSWPYADIYFLSYKDSSYSCCTPKESFISAIEDYGWYVNGNPYEKTCNKNMGDALSYIQAQEKVINLSNCYLFVKL